MTEQIAETIATEVAALTADLADLRKKLKGAQADAVKADASYRKFLRKPDAPISEKEDAARRKNAAAESAVIGYHDRITSIEKKIARLLDPAEQAERVARATHTPAPTGATNSKETTMAASTKTTKPAPVEVDAKIKARIVKEIKSGKGVTAVAKGLNDDGIAPVRGSKWHPPVVRGIFMKETGLSGIKAAREASPLKTTKAKVADKPAAATTKVTRSRGTAAAKKTEAAGDLAGPAKPAPKPASTRKSSSKPKASTPAA